MSYKIDRKDLIFKEINNRNILVVNKVTHSWSILDKQARDLLENNSIIPKNHTITPRLHQQGIIQKDDFYISHFSNPLLKVKKPFFLVIKLTSRCNFACEYCYAKKVKKEKIDKATLKKVIKEFLSLGNEENVILFHGGEPLLCLNEIKIAINYCKKIKSKKQRVKFKIQTNGSILTPEIIKLIKKEKISLGISLDLFNNNFYRKNSADKTTAELIENNIINLKKEGIYPSIISVITNKKTVSSKKIIKKLSAWGVKQIKLNPLFLTKESKNISSLDNFKYIKIMKEFCTELIKYNKKHPNNKLFEYNISALIKNMIYQNYTYMCCSSPYGAGTCIVSCNPNGDIFPCDEFCSNTSLILGNIKYLSLKSILSSKKISLLKNRRTEKIKDCKDCAFQFFCCAGCPSKIINSGGKLLQKSFFCNYYTKTIPFLIKLLENKDYKYLVIPPVKQ